MFSAEAIDHQCFDIVCAFQTFDHVAEPSRFLSDVLKVLNPGGRALFINHDVGAWQNRLLGERSPIIDVEHTFLYDRSTIRRLFELNGFVVDSVFAVANRYALGYWLHLGPFPDRMKAALITVADRCGWGRIRVSLRAGNLGIVAHKPDTHGSA
jgi:SAM-dependent methyltransferase